MVELRNKKSGGPFTKEDEEVGMKKTDYNNIMSVNAYNYSRHRICIYNL